MTSQQWYGIALLVIGLVNLLGCLTHNTWYWSSRKAQSMVRWIGLGPARVFYTVIGLMLLGAGVSMLLP